ncbi:MAG: hypothetical protein LBM93_03335 [Oscillospiraceae bacterium]|jgi:predicted small secreted protein|nr:hypothetical protein [Oscillospiraceae bacterium]
MKKIIAICFIFAVLCASGCSKNNTVRGTSGEIENTARQTARVTGTRPDYKNDGQETFCNLGETVNWNNTGINFSFTSVGVSQPVESQKYIMLDIIIQNTTEKNMNLNWVNAESVLVYNGDELLLSNLNKNVPALRAMTQYYTVDASDNYLYRAGTTQHFYLPFAEPENLSDQLKVSIFPDYVNSPDFLTFVINKEDLKELQPKQN